MWPTTVMEILFAGGMLSLVADLAGSGSPTHRPYGAAAVGVLALASS